MWTDAESRERIAPDLTYEDLVLGSPGDMVFAAALTDYQSSGLVHSVPFTSNESGPGRKIDHDDMAVALAVHIMFLEHEILAETLRARNPQLFQEYDRVRTEAELRYSLIPAVTALGVTLTLMWSVWWLFAFLSIPVLLYYGVRYERSARQRVATALTVGAISSPTIERLSQTKHDPSNYGAPGEGTGTE